MIERLPAIDAALNLSAAVLLVLGWLFIRRRNVAAHKACMLGAFGCSTLFLAGYLYYHAHAGIIYFKHGGWLRTAYLSILGTHTVLAVVIVPLVLSTLSLGLRGRFDSHRRWARRTLPLWIYVSVTGVVIYGCSFVFSALLLAVPALAAEPSLVFKVSGKPVAELTLSRLEAAAAPYTLTFVDPDYGKTKSFECLPLSAVLRAGFGPGWDDGSRPQAVFHALDGYASLSQTAKLAEPGACLAFADRDAPGWESIGRKGANPGPFYLVWAKPGQSPENAYPWPYQVASIELVRFEEAFPRVVPAGAKPGSPAARGFTIFQQRCFRCHSINSEGGKIGPDLNAPQSVTAYRSKKWIESYVRQPSKYRHTEMPDHLDLSRQDLDALYAYFRWKARQPEKPAGF